MLEHNARALSSRSRDILIAKSHRRLCGNSKGNLLVWTFDQINRDWLVGERIDLAPDDLVSAFVRCQQVLGRDWINRARCGATGIIPTFNVAAVGEQLASIDDVYSSTQFITKLRDGDQSAFAELQAIHLLRKGEPTIVELEPTVRVGKRERKCDFRIKRWNEPWVYVEATRPDTSKAKGRVETLLRSIVDVVSLIERQFALEVFFRREPTDAEVQFLLTYILEFCSVKRAEAGVITEDMPDGLGMLILNKQVVGQVVLSDHGDVPVPRLGAARTIIGQPSRHVVARVPFADERAEQFLTTEARQLPTDAPSLIMVDMGGVPGGFASWVPIIERRFQPAMHTRVGAVCLFGSGLESTPRGAAVLFDTQLISNRYAKIPLPDWIKATISRIKKETAAKTHQSDNDPLC